MVFIGNLILGSIFCCVSDCDTNIFVRHSECGNAIGMAEMFKQLLKYIQQEKIVPYTINRALGKRGQSRLGIGYTEEKTVYKTFQI